MNISYPFLKNQLKQGFPLLNSDTLEQCEKDNEIKGSLNSLILSLNHKCFYEWTEQQVDSWSNSGSKQKQIKLLAITWNMHGMMPGYSLQRLFQTGTTHHDLIVIGTQECQRSIAVSLICSSKESWESKLSLELGKKYVKINSVTLNAMHLVAFSHVDLVSKIRNGQTYELSQGFMNVVGNKGGIGLSMAINDKIFLFVNSHLESGQKAQQVRSAQFRTLDTFFDNSIKKQEKIKYDYLIWTGDFNSRIEIDLNRQSLKEKNSDFLRWLSQDQMFLERKLGTEFYNKNEGIHESFKEGMILFPPTYKLQEGFNQWAVNSDFRIPGWCDRILFKENTSEIEGNSIVRVMPIDSKQHDNLILHNYDANFDIYGSDHRPVYAQFTAIIQ